MNMRDLTLRNDTDMTDFGTSSYRLSTLKMNRETETGTETEMGTGMESREKLKN